MVLREGCPMRAVQNALHVQHAGLTLRVKLIWQTVLLVQRQVCPCPGDQGISHREEKKRLMHTIPAASVAQRILITL